MSENTTTVENTTVETASDAADKAKASELRKDAQLMQLVTLLSGMPLDHWAFVKSEVAALRRESTSTATKAGTKLFGPGIMPNASRLALEFNNGTPAGIFDVVNRETAKGREGKVTLTLKNIADGNILVLNSREHAGIVAECFARRAPNAAK